MSKAILEKPQSSTLTRIPDSVTGLLHPYHEKLLADDSLRDLDVVMLAQYLLENEQQRTGVSYEALKCLFVQLGRKERPNFGVAIHQAKKQNLIEQDEGTKEIYFKIQGLKNLELIIGLNGKAPVRLIKAGQHFRLSNFLKNFCQPRLAKVQFFCVILTYLQQRFSLFLN